MVYQELPSEKWRSSKNNEDKRQTLWDAFLLHSMNPESGSRIYKTRQVPSQKQTRKWLIWLAKQLEKTNQSEFLLEKLQPEQIGGSGQIAIYGFATTFASASIFYSGSHSDKGQVNYSSLLISMAS